MARKEYTDQSISSLKGADRVRKRPAVIFGSDGLEGCKHSFFEILSNSIDESREGYGKEITITVYKDRTIEVVFLSTSIKRKTDTTGSLFIASFMQAVSTIIIRKRVRINTPSA